MTINLAGYKDIETGLFVKIVVTNYRTSENSTPVTEDLLFSDYYRPVTIGSDTYLPLGGLVTLSNTKSELRASANSLDITISGIPNESIQEIAYSDIKGSPVSIYRGLFNKDTGIALPITGNPVGRFFGFVNNYSIDEEIEILELSGTSTIVLQCNSYISLLNSFVNGRRTNPVDQKQLYPGDASFDRVPTLVGQNYNFGAPK